jgi:dCTP deaminase
MSTLVDHQIAHLCHAYNMVDPYDPLLVNSASLDIRLGDSMLIETVEHDNMVSYPFSSHTKENPYMMAPGQFILVASLETFRIPEHVCATFKLKSSAARNKFDHANAGFGDPGLHGSKLTMELTNLSQFHLRLLWPGMRIGQMIFSWTSGVPEKPYNLTGRYNNDTEVAASKGID